jgi:hypothetical protein
VSKIKTDDWRNLPIDKWNATTYRAYMKHLHQERFKIPYVANNYRAEGGMIKNMQKEYGNEVTKRFVEKCFTLHKPTNPKFPGLTFGFMYSYLRERYLPLVFVELEKERLKAKRTQQAQNDEIDTGWF